MARTGTRQPPSCRKRPHAVGQSVMWLPETPPPDAARLRRKGTDLRCWWQSRHSSPSAGRPRTGRRTVVPGVVRMESGPEDTLLPLRVRRRRASTTLQASARTALEGKPDAMEVACPVWRGAQRNLLPESGARRVVSIPILMKPLASGAASWANRTLINSVAAGPRSGEKGHLEERGLPIKGDPR
jgi:hypothetical protein